MSPKSLGPLSCPPHTKANLYCVDTVEFSADKEHPVSLGYPEVWKF